MRGLILLLATAITCNAGYIGSSPYGNPLTHSQHRQIHPPAPVGEDGNVIDTPEVAQAKAAHFAEFARAAARAAEDDRHLHHVPDYNPHVPSPYNHHGIQPTYLRQGHHQHPAPVYQTHGHAPVYNPVSYRHPQHYGVGSNFVGPKNYAAPLKAAAFIPAPLAEDGTVLDTPEVAALKATRLAELAEAEARAQKHASLQQYSPEESHDQGYSGSPAAGHGNYNHGLHYGALRAFPAAGPSYLGAQPYIAQQTAFGKPHNPSSAYQPHHYPGQHLIRTY